MLDQDESLNVSAKTVDDAIAQGLAQLGLSRNQVDIEVVKEGRRGVFGIGAENAVVRLTPRKMPEPEPTITPPQEVVEPETVTVKTGSNDFQPHIEDTPEMVEPPHKPEAHESPSSDDVPVVEDEEGSLDPDELTKQEAVKFLIGLLDGMGVEAMVSARLGDDLCEADETPPLVLDITGRDLGILIGRRNATLRSLQYIVRLAVNKNSKNRRPILVDVESYRVRRRQSLQKLAYTMAEQAVNNHRRVVMEAMSAYERRIVHVALRNNTKVRTKSIGGNDNRRVTIIPK